ncbi:MAG: DUF111 family protein, partial [Clostridiales bacterium]|nr:DUF111 family protein [Clostridiales bacterium]
MKILYFDCFSGISGDMALGALLDLGIDCDAFIGELAKLHIHGFDIDIKKANKHSITGTDVTVILHDAIEPESQNASGAPGDDDCAANAGGASGDGRACGHADDSHEDGRGHVAARVDGHSHGHGDGDWHSHVHDDGHVHSHGHGDGDGNSHVHKNGDGHS